MPSSTKCNKTTKPLSAYNLFFQYNRIKLLASLDNDGLSNLSKPDSTPPPGLEYVDSKSPLQFTSEPEIRRYRKQIIESTIDNSPFNDPSMKAGYGSMTFLEMSKYMSKEWKGSDETTKSIFRQISNERKAKHQKQQFDLYKKSAERFSLTAKSAALAKIVSKPNNVDSFSKAVSTDSRLMSLSKNERVMSNSLIKNNSEWEEQLRDVSKSGNPRYSRVSTSPDFNDIRARRRNSHEEFETTLRAQNAVAIGPIRSSIPPCFAPDNVDRPLPFLGSTEKLLSNGELLGWLSGLDWNHI
ncbi:hypothetical protein ACHAXS_003326 [Conticribra weissflogii]